MKTTTHPSSCGSTAIDLLKATVGTRLCIAAGMVFLGGSHASANLLLLDDFNDGSTSGWTVQTSGSQSESGGVRSGWSTSLETMDGIAESTVGVDAIHGGGGVAYVALVTLYNDLSDNLFVKLQDNDGNGSFDSVFFYHGNNLSDGLVGADYYDLSFEVSSTYFQLTNNLDGTVSAFVQATGDVIDGTLTNSYTGTGTGLGFYGNGQADNFYGGPAAVVPEPSSSAMFGIGALGLFGYSRRRRQTSAAA